MLPAPNLLEALNSKKQMLIPRIANNREFTGQAKEIVEGISIDPTCTRILSSRTRGRGALEPQDFFVAVVVDDTNKQSTGGGGWLYS
jgi:hypothetical protein